MTLHTCQDDHNVKVTHRPHLNIKSLDNKSLDIKSLEVTPNLVNSPKITPTLVNSPPEAMYLLQDRTAIEDQDKREHQIRN